MKCIEVTGLNNERTTCAIDQISLEFHPDLVDDKHRVFFNHQADSTPTQYNWIGVSEEEYDRINRILLELERRNAYDDINGRA